MIIKKFFNKVLSDKCHFCNCKCKAYVIEDKLHNHVCTTLSVINTSEDCNLVFIDCFCVY